jgi:hypothetical protein
MAHLPSIEGSEIEGCFFSTIFDVRIGSVLKKDADRIEMSELGRRVQSRLLVRVLEKDVKDDFFCKSELRMKLFISKEKLAQITDFNVILI